MNSSDVRTSPAADRRAVGGGETTGSGSDDLSIIGDSAPELVVLLDEEHRPIGTMRKDQVHTAVTPLHLAFSVYVFDPDGRLLITRRAIDKRTWPGVWTNSCCGHPAPEESMDLAVRRRLADELGLQVEDLTPALPDFAYRAVAADGLVENEVCPVFVARATSQPAPDPREVSEFRWVSWQDYHQVAVAAPWAISPWSVLQVEQLAELGGHPLDVIRRR